MSVILSTTGGGGAVLSRGAIHSGGCCTEWGVLSLAGGAILSRGCCEGGAMKEPPPVGQQAGSMHSTEMHSCTHYFHDVCRFLQLLARIF